MKKGNRGPVLTTSAAYVGMGMSVLAGCSVAVWKETSVSVFPPGNYGHHDLGASCNLKRCLDRSVLADSFPLFNVLFTSYTEVNYLPVRCNIGANHNTYRAYREQTAPRLCRSTHRIAVRNICHGCVLCARARHLYGNLRFYSGRRQLSLACACGLHQRWPRLVRPDDE